LFDYGVGELNGVVVPPQALKTKAKAITAPSPNCHRFFIMLEILPFVYK